MKLEDPASKKVTSTKTNHLLKAMEESGHRGCVKTLRAQMKSSSDYDREKLQDGGENCRWG